MYIDTHAHLWFDDYKDDLAEVIERARAASVEKIVVPGTDTESSKLAIELSKKYQNTIYAAVGVHPEEISKFTLPSRSDLQTAIAIGEIGTDASTEGLRGCMNEQKELFKKQCEIALEYDLPIIVHTRESLGDALEVLDNLPKMPRGQFHCFSHDEDGIRQVIERGFYVSFCGNISWSKRVAKLVKLVPDDRLLLETDSPLMVPRDRMGEPVAIVERNEPANVVHLAQLIADLRNQNIENIGNITTDNAKRLFRL